ncbi:SAV_2336 N-terminal domain-related protein [Actinoallomurus sp. CA-150999]|uniref:SAV_2336 N-terminal domain-related protein n=1 Tax=Actinoallomurus sp. CA-150999 TaxID=3239887 RepID=UPI003D8CCD4E
MADLERVLAALADAGLPPDAVEIADALWLARYLPTHPDHPLGVPEEDGRGDPPDEVDRASPGAGPSGAMITRALRPLLQTVPSRTSFVLDEAATAEWYAAGGAGSAVFRPASERWLDAVLVVDDGPSMVIWRSWIDETSRLLQRTGGFRDVRVWMLDTDGPLGLRRRSSYGPVRSVRELAGGPGERVILVLSDCVGSAWQDGRMAATLEIWARSGLVTVVQPLVERLWSRCGPEFFRVRLSALRPGTANAGLRAELTETPGITPEGAPIPVLRLDPEWINWWGRVVTGRTSAARTGVALFTRTPSRERPPAAEPPTSRDLVGRFRASVSPLAFELAVQLSAVPLNLRVMRRVQALMRKTTTLHLAEVMLGGLLHRLPSPDRTDPLAPSYDFHPGVREELGSYLGDEEARRLRREVSGLSMHI